MKNLTLLAALSTAFCSNTFASCVDHIVDDLLKKPTTHELFDPAISNKAVRDLFDANYSSQNSEAVIKKINEITGGSITVNPSDKTMSIDGSKVELIWVDKASKLRITKAANKVCTNAQGAQHLMKLMASGLNPIATSDYESISDVMRNWWYKNESWSLELSPYTGELPMCHVHPISGQIHSSVFLESRAKQYRDAVKLTENWTMDTHGTFNSAWSIFRVKDATEDYVVTELSKLIIQPSRTFIRGASTDKFIRQIVRSCQMRTWLEYESEGCVWVKKSSDPSLSSLDKKATLTALMNNASLDAQYILYTGNLPTDSIAANQLYGAISSIGAGCIGMTEYVSKRYAVLKEEWHNTQKFVESWNSNGDWETILIPSFVAPIPIPDDSAKNIFFNYQGDSESALDALNNISERAIASLRSYVEGGDISIIWSTPPVLRIGALKYGQDPQLVLGLLNTLRVKARLEIDASDSGTEADVFKWWALHNDAVNGMYLRTPIKRPQYGHVPALWVLTLDGVTMEAPPAPMNPIPVFSPVLPVLQPNNSAANIFNNYQVLNNYLSATIQPSIAQGDIAQQSFLKFVRALDAATNGAFTKLTDLTMSVPKISDTGIVIGKLKPGMNAASARATLNSLMTKSQQLTSAFEVINYHEDQHIVEGDMLFPPKDCVVGVDDGSVENMLKGWLAGYVGNVLMRPSGFIPVVPPVVPAVNKLLQVEGYFPLEIINGTKRDDSEVYVFIKAAQESDGRDCVFARVEDEDTTNGLKLRAETVTETMVTDYSILPNYNYRLDTVAKTSDGRRILLVPPSISGRVYFSVGRPIAMQAKVDAKDMIRIGDPDGFKPRDPNYYTLYDKVEYTFKEGEGSWLNPTCVDFISLPIHVEQPGAASEIKSAGFAGSRKAVFKSIKDTFAPDAVSPEWSKLVLPFEGADSRRTDLRIMAPGKAMVKDMPGANPFNTRYLNAGIPPFNTHDLDSASFPGFNYTDHLWEYYKTNTLAVNAIELKGKFKIRPNPAEETVDDFQFLGSVDGEDRLVFTNKTGTRAEAFDRSSTKIPFLAGAQESDDAPKNTIIEVIMRELSSAFAFSYTDFVWEHHKTNRLRISAKEIWSKFRIDGKEPGNVGFEDAYMFTGTVNENNEFVFTSGSGSVVRKIGKPLDSVPFFAGAQGAFDAANNTPEAVIVRELTSAFEVGLLPAPDNTLLNKDYFISKRSSFYKTNGYLPPRATAGKGPWYDLYSQALHKAAGELPVYTFAYDDALAQDGTLHDSDGAKPHLVQITIGDLTGVEIPDPEKDPNLYKIKFDVPSALTVLQENGASQLPQLTNNQELSGVKMPLALNVNGKPIKLYVNPPMVMPPYQHAEGIVVERTGTDVTLRFPGVFDK